MHLTAPLPDRTATPSARLGRRLALLWLVVALLFQGLVVQTHAHIGADRYATVTSATNAAAALGDRQKDGPAAPACPLCAEKVLFGAYLLGGSVTIAAPIGAAYNYAAAFLPLLQLHASSHAWRSRAPPTFTL
ncbi:MAG: hypothetical protein ABIQ43_09110 [Sphingomonas sp.]